MSKSRGFKKLKGVKIGEVDAQAINQVKLFSADESCYFEINVLMSQDGIPVLTCTKHKIQIDIASVSLSAPLQVDNFIKHEHIHGV